MYYWPKENKYSGDIAIQTTGCPALLAYNEYFSMYGESGSSFTYESFKFFLIGWG